MSWFNNLRGGAVFALVLLLSSCGFQPLYTRDVTAPWPHVEIANIPDREGQYLRNLLTDRLYARSAPADARYTLQITRPGIKISSLGIRKDATSTRGQVDISATVTLRDKASGDTLLQRYVQASGGYNRLDNRYATFVSEESSVDLVLKELSDAVMTELDLYFSRADSPS
jgi:LPS-assembly lipoprotein